jgi:hypothetical protein
MQPPRLMGTQRRAVGPVVGTVHRGVVERAFNGGLRSRFSFPNHRGFSGFPGNGFGFFGFPPHHHPGFFFFSGVGFFSGFPFFGFPFFDSFLGFDGLRHDPFGRFGFRRRHFGFPGFPHDGFGFFGRQRIPAGALLGWTPYFGTLGYAYPYVSAGGAYPTDTTTARDIYAVSDTRPALGRQVAVPGVGEALGDTLLVEQVSVMDIVPSKVLRLTWRNPGLNAAQVALFLADTAQGVLSAQTLRSPPFTALFEPPPGTAFAGMTVVWPDGTLSTRFVPYRRRAR